MSLSEDKVYPSNDAESQSIFHQKPADTPLPKTQLAVVLLISLAEPIAYAQIFPYINAVSPLSEHSL